jgi:deoxyribodipyrimidine photo-lyase
MGLKRLHDYVHEYGGMKDYAILRNGFKGANFSSKLSPWLANGCLSPRKVFWEIIDW